jgi:hypothetical protein
LCAATISIGGVLVVTTLIANLFAVPTNRLARFARDRAAEPLFDVAIRGTPVAIRLVAVVACLAPDLLAIPTHSCAYRGCLGRATSTSPPRIDSAGGAAAIAIGHVAIVAGFDAYFEAVAALWDTARVHFALVVPMLDCALLAATIVEDGVAIITRFRPQDEPVPTDWSASVALRRDCHNCLCLSSCRLFV